MVTIKFRSEKMMEEMHEALKGSKEFVDSKIALCIDLEKSGYMLMVGEPNENDLVITMMEYGWE